MTTPATHHRPPFLVVEGVDGAGKSSHIPAIVEVLSAAGWDVVVTREPGGTPMAERCRRILLNHPDDLTPLTQALLAMAARSDHVDKVIRPALDSGRAVVCDRFTPSTHAYQFDSLPAPDREAMEAVERQTHAGIEPDCVMFFDLDPTVAQERLLGTGKTPDRFESQGANFFARVRAAYLTALSSRNHRIIDAASPLSDVRTNVTATVTAWLESLPTRPSTRPTAQRQRL